MYKRATKLTKTKQAGQKSKHKKNKISERERERKKNKLKRKPKTNPKQNKIGKQVVGKETKGKVIREIENRMSTERSNNKNRIIKPT